MIYTLYTSCYINVINTINIVYFWSVTKRKGTKGHREKLKVLTNVTLLLLFNHICWFLFTLVLGLSEKTTASLYFGDVLCVCFFNLH